MIDAVLSYHLNPLTCGVAKFNQQLAQRLGVPCLPMGTVTDHPLGSIKPSEVKGSLNTWGTYSVLLHDRTLPDDHPVLRYARRVFYADDLGLPSTVQGNPIRGAYRVVTFGMAHKLVLPHFERLKEQLDREHPDYTLSLSCAVHEGSPWEGALQESADSLRAIFGDKLRVLGFLMDDALAKELQDCDAVAAFFTPALRGNNTSYWAAVEAGKPVYTNRDELSPPDGAPAPTWERLVEILRETGDPR